MSAELDREVSEDWEELPTAVLQMMSWLGEFRPTIDPKLAELKGCRYDRDDAGTYKCYIGPRDLRDLAHASTVAADWLERRQRAALAAVAQGGAG